jgi:hypothetical protein
VRVNDETDLLEIENSKNPMGYSDAAELASRSAKADSEDFRPRLTLRRRGTEIGDPGDNGSKRTMP